MEPKKDLPIIAFEKVLKQSDALRISDDSLSTFAHLTEEMVKEVGNRARKYAQHAGRKTIMARDIELALQELEH